MRSICLIPVLLLLAACSALSLETGDTDGAPFERIDGAAQTPTALAGDPLAAADAVYQLLTNIYERTSPSVVNVEALVTAEDGSAVVTRRGSGFVYDQQGHIVTNAHLVQDADLIRVTLHSTWVHEADLVGADSFSDLAVLRVTAAADKLAPLWIGESASLQVGQRAIVISNPMGLSSSMTTGIVSGLGRTLPSADLQDADDMPGFENPSIIQFDAAIHPGSSGGPLLDAQGLLIGITTAIHSDGAHLQGIGLAVPADTMRRVIPELIAVGRVDYAWLGISVMREDGGFGVAGLRETLDLPVDRGVLLRGVTEGSPAHLADLRGGDLLADVRGESVCAGGDIIVAINGFHIDNLNGLVTYLVQNTSPGDAVELLVIRDQRTIEVRLTPQKRPTAGNQRLLDCSVE